MKNSLRAGRLPSVACLLAALLVGCAASAPVGPGSTREQLQAQRGEPRATYALPMGVRLFYSDKPGERQRFDFDARDRLVDVQQVFTRAHFEQLAQGGSDSAAVQRSFGPPARQSANGEAGRVWTYSWLEVGTWRLARVRFDAAGAVRGVDFSEDPLADEHYR